MKLKKILLLTPCLLLAACNSSSFQVKLSDNYVGISIQKKNDSSVNYIATAFTFSAADGPDKDVTKDNFTAKVEGKEVKASCLISNIEISGHLTNYYFDNVVDKKTIKGEGAKETTSVYVAFDYNSGVKSTSEFYCKGIKITNNYVEVKF